MTDWMTSSKLQGDQVIVLLLLDMDIKSARLSLKLYLKAKRSIMKPPANAKEAARKQKQMMESEDFIHAKNYVTAMRRVARLLELLKQNKDELFPRSVGRVANQCWKRKKRMLKSYTDPRDAIEHIDNKIEGKNNWVMLNLISPRDVLQVDEGIEAEISERNLKSVIEGRNEIIQEIIRIMPG